jgi:tRNA modification GTPase
VSLDFHFTMEYKDETIAAIATPVGIGGIGIIKISGRLAEGISQKIFRPRHPIKSLENFRLYLGHVIDPDSGLPIDEVLLSIMRGPLSYTREDVVEINSHSGYAILSRVLQIILRSGARLAKPGEFTLRAFLNGRIDLTQAEAVVDLINAKSETSLYLAAHQLSGGLLARLEEIRGRVLELLVEIEACIDFPDDQPISIERDHTGHRIRTAILEPIKELISAFSQRKMWQEGTVIVLAGRVNVGKSSIFNRMLQNERALVTPLPGTTRDIIECGISIKGIPIRLMDTAGIRKVRGMVEKKGLGLTKACLGSADIILLVIDRSKTLTQYDTETLRAVMKKRVIVVINKIDLPQRVSEKKLEAVFGNLQRVFVSAVTGEGFDHLMNTVHEHIMSPASPMPSIPLIPNLRHATALRQAADCLDKAAAHVRDGLPLEIVAADLVWAKNSIDEITGKKIGEDLIDGVFTRFCIGK